MPLCSRHRLWRLNQFGDTGDGGNARAYGVAGGPSRSGGWLYGRAGGYTQKGPEKCRSDLDSSVEQ